MKSKEVQSINVMVSQTLSKNFIVETDDYVETWEDDYDDETNRRICDSNAKYPRDGCYVCCDRESISLREYEG